MNEPKRNLTRFNPRNVDIRKPVTDGVGMEKPNENNLSYPEREYLLALKQANPTGSFLPNKTHIIHNSDLLLQWPKKARTALILKAQGLGIVQFNNATGKFTFIEDFE